MLALKYLIDEKMKQRQTHKSLTQNKTQEAEPQTELSTERASEGQSSH